MAPDVLVVEDEPDIRNLIVHHLTRDGFRCRTAATGAEALTRVRTAAPDLVVLDLMLPEMSGLEVCRRLRGDPATAAAWSTGSRRRRACLPRRVRMYTEAMSVRPCRLVHRLARATTGCLLGGAVLVPLGPTTTSQAVNQMNATSMRGTPPVASRPVVRDSMIWVPARMVPLPGEGTVMVPGHWERRLDGREVHVPPLTVRNPETGATTTLPAGVRPPVDERFGP